MSQKKGKSSHKKKYSATTNKSKKSVFRSAITDHLTGLYNRRHFDKSLRKIISDSTKEHKHFSLLMADIDNFKSINDKYGHLAGDKILTDLAKVLKKSVRGVDICFRYGGDEITIILPDAEKKAAENIMMRLITKLDGQKFLIEGGYKLQLQLSIGLSVFPEDGLTPKTLIKKADDLLYKAKRQKKRQKGKTTEPFILKTKLIPPLLKDTVVSRPRLLSLLKENINKKLIIVNADAGYGKTTLLTQLIKGLKTPYIWYQVDKSDQELDLFIRYLIEGMKKYIPSFGRRTLNVINYTTERGIEREVLIGTFINELIEASEEKIVFVFDDLQEVYESNEVTSGFEFLLNHLPTNVSIIISARSNTPFSLERLHLKNDTLIIDQQNLKFNKGEIKMLCKQIGGYTPKPAELKEFSADSEGWITSLQFLVHLSKQKSIFAKGKKSLINRLYAYFDKEVFSSLNEDLKLFLTASSVFEYLSPEACNFLLRRDNSEHILRELEKRHLFISAYDASEPTYRYHHLFRNFLTKELRETVLHKKFQNRAGTYWEKKGAFSTAVQHYFEGKNFKSSVRLIEKFGDNYIALGKFQFVKHCIEYLPDTIINNNPILLRLRGRICVWDYDWNNAKAFYSKARQIAQRQKNDREVFKIIRDLLAIKIDSGKHKGVIAQIRNVLRCKELKNLKLKTDFLNILGCAFSLEGKLNEAIAVFEEILKLSKKIDDNVRITRTLNNLGIANMQIGNFACAQKYLERLTNKLRSDPLPLLSFALTALGDVLRLQGKLTKAEEVLKEGQKYSQLFNDRHMLCMSYIILGFIKIYNGMLEQAEEFLNKAQNLGTDIGLDFVLSYVWSGMAELAINRGDFFEAKQYIDRALEVAMPPRNKALFLIIKASLELFLKNLHATEKTLNQAFPNLKESKHELMKFYLQMARFYFLKKDEIKVKNYLYKAVALSEKNSYDFLLSYELKHCPEIIRFVKRIKLKSPYLQHLLLKLPYSEATEIFVEPDIKDYDFVVRLFDKIQICKAGKEIKASAWKTKRFQELFAFFVVNHSLNTAREKITSTFWPDHNPNTARQLFHNALYEIRKTAGENIIIFHKEGYTLSSKYSYWIDTQEFETLIREANKLATDGNRAASLIKYEEALSLNRGGFMDDFYSEWCQEKRRYFEEIYYDLLRKLSNGHYKLGNFRKSLQFCNIVIGKNLYNEEIYCLAMRCHAALNDLGELQKCFSNLKKNLVEGLNTVPHPETVKLFEAFMERRQA